MSLILLLLVLLNTYPIRMSRNLAFSSKQTSMHNQAAVVATSLSELGRLTEDEVFKVMSLLDNMNMTRVIVTDTDARIMFDTSETEDNIGKYAVFSEIRNALNGKDVFYSVLSEGAFMSRAAIPIRYRGTTIGAVYLYEYDSNQASLISAIQGTMLRFSYLVCALSILLALVFSRIITKRINVILSAIKVVREGSYNYNLDLKGKDELSQLGHEFNRMAERLKTTDEMRRRFVSDASHELKTPLAAIKLLSDSIVQNENMDPRTIREFVSDIGRESDRLAKITEKLLSISRLEGEKREKPYKVDVKTVVLRALQLIRPLAEDGGIELKNELENDCAVLATEDDLHQIVFNLVENAVKYTPHGGEVRVTLAKSETEVCLVVADTGIGIPSEDLPYIFDRFYRVDKARSREAGGSGLGLSIVQHAVLIHGGTVKAESVETGGTKFTVCFPSYREEGKAS